jgi:hypothetical protein
VDGALHRSLEQLVVNRAHSAADVEQDGCRRVRRVERRVKRFDEKARRPVRAAAAKAPERPLRLAPIELALDTVTLRTRHRATLPVQDGWRHPDGVWAGV